MNQSEVLKEFEQTQAILRGHFILSSGLHSDTYMQCARVLSEPKRAEKLCAALANKIRKELPNESFDMVFSPAMGGVIVGYEMGRQLGIPAIFCERVDGNFSIRRGFEIKKGTRILVVEDVVTTGKSSLEAIKCAEDAGGKIVAEACLINRSGTDQPIKNFKLIALAKIEVQTFPASEIPESLKNVPAIKPGSRWLK